MKRQTDASELAAAAHESVERVERRQLIGTLASAAGLVWLGCAPPPQQPRVASGVASPASRRDEPEAETDEAPTPAEDLMQEHGLIDRVLLIYDEAATRLERRELAAAALAADAAQIVKRFVEAYHEQLEEAFVFPRLEGDPRHGPLVRTLIEQHEKGRAATTEILRLSQSKDAPGLARHLRSFSRMYRAHAAWEDSVLFPAFRGAVGAGEYRDLGEKFEEEERQRFGEHGFEEMLAQVSRIEHGLDIAELSKFTPA